MKKIILCCSIALVSSISFGQKKNNPVKLSNTIDSLSYAIGLDLGESFKQNDLDKLDLEILIRAMQDIYNQIPQFDVEAGKQFIQTEMNRRAEIKASIEKEKGIKFLEENKKKQGVQTTASGLQYKVIKEGNGVKPTSSDTVVVHYHGTLTDGTVFDSSIERGETVEFPLNQVIEGWIEGVQLMSVGSKYMFYVPENLAYGERAMGNITAYSTLIFEVELFNVKKAQ